MARKSGADRLVATARKVVQHAAAVAVGTQWRLVHRAEALLARAAGVVGPLGARGARRVRTSRKGRHQNKPEVAQGAK